MGKPIKNLDNLFQSNLNKFEQEPSLQVWEGIEQKLDQLDAKKYKKKYLWLRWSAAAAILLSFLLSIILFYNNKTDNKNISQHKQETFEDKKILSKKFLSTANKNEVPVSTQTSTNKSSSKNIAGSNNYSSNNSNNNGDTNISSNTIFNKIKKDLIQPTILIDSVLPSLTQLANLIATTVLPQTMQVAINNEVQLYPMAVLPLQLPKYNAPQSIVQPIASLPNTPIKKLKRFSISASYTPLYSYRFKLAEFDDLIPIDTNPVVVPPVALTASVPKETIVEKPLLAFSSSILVFYDLTNRVSIGTGLTYTKSGQRSIYNNTVYSPLDDSASVEQSNYYTINTSSAYGTLSSNYYATNTNSVKLTSMTQKFSYLEIPFLIKYRIAELNRLTVNTTIGASVNYMLGTTSKLTIEDSEGNLQTLASFHEEPLKSVHAGAIIKLGIEYSLAPAINFRLEPFFKTALTPVINKTYPFSVGLDCGISFHF